MARYWFTAYDGSVEQERAALELQDLGSVREAAVSFAAGIMTEAGASVFAQDLHVEVKNEAGLVLYDIIVVATDMVRSAS